MPNLLSTGTAFAGYYFDAVLGWTGTPAVSTPVTVYQSDGVTKATLYTSQTKGSTTGNPLNTDATGNLFFYTNPGLYVLSYIVGGVTTTKTVMVAPWYSDGAWNNYGVNTSASPISGDAIYVNDTSASTITMPAAVEGARVRVFNYNTGTCTVQRAGSDSFYGMGTSATGVNSFTLPSGGSVTAFCTFAGVWSVVAGGFGPQVTEVYLMTASASLGNYSVSFTAGTVSSNTGLMSYNSGTGRLTVNVAGTYLISQSITTNGNGGNGAGAYFQLLWNHNGSGIPGTTGSDTGYFLGNYPSVTGYCITSAAAGDYFAAGVAGSGMGTALTFNNSIFSVALIGGQV